LIKLKSPTRLRDEAKYKAPQSEFVLAAVGVPGCGEAAIRHCAMLVNLRAFEPDLDCVSVINVAYDPARFKHDPSHGMCGVRQAALRYLHAVNKDKNVIVVIPVNLANGFLVNHGFDPRVSV
jgi:hypothetical protein